MPIFRHCLAFARLNCLFSTTYIISLKSRKWGIRIRRIKEIIAEHKRPILYFAINIASQILHLSAIIILTSKFTVSEYGAYSLIISFANIAVLLGISWSASAIIYIGVKEIHDEDSICKTLTARLLIVLIFSIPIIITIFILKSQIRAYLEFDKIYLLVIYYLVNIVISTITNYLLAIEKQLSLSAVQLFSTVILFVLFLSSSLTPQQALLFNIISQSSIIIGLISIRKKDFKLRKFDPVYFKEVLFFSLSQLLGFLGGYMITYGGNIIVNHFLSKNELGIFNLSFRLFTNITAILLLINTFYAPMVVRDVKAKNYESLKKYMYKIRPLSIILFVSGSILLALIAKYIIPFIFGKKYLASVVPFIILLIAVIPFSIEVFYIALYNSLGKFLTLQITIILQALITLLLMLILVPKIQIYGAVIAIVLGYVFKAIFSIVYLEKKVHLLLTEIKKGV